MAVSLKWQGAGVLPFAWSNTTANDPNNKKKLMVLLGQELRGNGWADFGGKPHYGESEIQTAARNAISEINGISHFNDFATLAKRLQSDATKVTVVDEKMSEAYQLFLLEIDPTVLSACSGNKADCQCLPCEFNRSLTSHPQKRKVKGQLRWFNFSDLYNAVTMNSNVLLCNRASMAIQIRDPDDKTPIIRRTNAVKETYRIRNCFAPSVIEAAKHFFNQ